MRIAGLDWNWERHEADGAAMGGGDDPGGGGLIDPGPAPSGGDEAAPEPDVDPGVPAPAPEFNAQEAYSRLDGVLGRTTRKYDQSLQGLTDQIGQYGTRFEAIQAQNQQLGNQVQLLLHHLMGGDMPSPEEQQRQQQLAHVSGLTEQLQSLDQRIQQSETGSRLEKAQNFLESTVKRHLPPIFDGIEDGAELFDELAGWRVGQPLAQMVQGGKAYDNEEVDGMVQTISRRLNNIVQKAVDRALLAASKKRAGLPVEDEVAPGPTPAGAQTRGGGGRGSTSPAGKRKSIVEMTDAEVDRHAMAVLNQLESGRR